MSASATWIESDNMVLLHVLPSLCLGRLSARHLDICDRSCGISLRSESLNVHSWPYTYAAVLVFPVTGVVCLVTVTGIKGTNSEYTPRVKAW